MSDGYESVRQLGQTVGQTVGGVLSLPASGRARWRTLDPVEGSLHDLFKTAR
jgi:hypothetical protein